MLQFERIYISFESNPTVSLTTYQNDTIWGLYIIEGVEKSKLPSPEINCIFREREIEEIPTGIITSTSVKCDENGDIFELGMGIDKYNISFKAGEVYRSGH